MIRLFICALLALLGGSALAAQRVVSLAPSLSEMVVELGAVERLVGVLDGGERPAALAHLPSVGRYGHLELETLIGLQPDLLLVWPGSVSVAQREQLAQFGIPLLELEPHSLDELSQQFERVGAALGITRRGEVLGERFRRGVAVLRQRHARAQPLRVFYQVWDQPLRTVGGGQIISDALSVCGGRNLFAELRLPAPLVSVEAVLQRDPQVILAADPAQLQPWRRWPALSAVRGGGLQVVPDKGLERPSFQMLGAISRLCEALAPLPR